VIVADPNYAAMYATRSRRVAGAPDRRHPLRALAGRHDVRPAARGAPPARLRRGGSQRRRRCPWWHGPESQRDGGRWARVRPLGCPERAAR